LTLLLLGHAKLSTKKLTGSSRKKRIRNYDCAQIVPVKVKHFRIVPNGTKNTIKI
jgi:hypothetical protein